MKCNRVVGLVVVLAAGFICGPAAAQVSVTPTLKPTPAGQLIVVNNGPVDQNDPHVSGNLVVYSNTDATNSTIHYFDLASLTDKAIPNSGTNPRDFLSDVRGTTIVFTRVTSGQSAIFSFDTASGLLTEIAPQAGSTRRLAQIGDQTIAWQDFGFSNSATIADIVAYDRQSGTTTRLANDSALNDWPGISPDGKVIVWGKCPTISSPCTTWLATLSNGTWTARQVSSQVETDAAIHPDTDGTIVAYTANSGSGDQLLWQPVSGGAEQILNLQGGQGSTPSISAGLIAFSYLPANASSHEIALYDVANNVLYNLTGDIGAQPGADKQLNDISVTPDGQVRIVWEVRQTDLNIYAYTFSLAPPKYTLTDLGPMQISAAPSGATALNGSGQVAGFLFDTTVGANRAFLWNSGTLSELGTLGGASSFGYGINAAGQVVGTADLSANAGNTQRAFIWQNGSMSNLGDPNPAGSYSTAFGINVNGDVAGYQNDGLYHPVIWKAGIPTGATVLTTLPCIFTMCQGEALAINDSGQAAGWSNASPSGSHAVMWDSSGQPTDLGTLGGTSNTQANGINKNAVVVGYSQLDPNVAPSTVHAFVWQGGNLQDLGAIPGPDPNVSGTVVDTNSSAWGINSKGDIVGISAPGQNAVLSGSGGRAFLNTGGVMYDLGSLLAPGTNWKLEAAWAINDNGQIVGVGFNPQGVEHGYLLTPSTAPTTTTLAASVNPSVFGQQVSITSTVSPNSSSSFTPGGNVTFSDGSNALQTLDLASGTAIFNTSALAVGSHTITASYSGDVNFNSSTSGPLSQTVGQGTTTTLVAVSPSPGISGQSVTLTAIVTAVAPASGVPTGAVTFMDGTTALAPPVTVAGGQATFTTSSLTTGAHSISAVYSGDLNFLTSTSATFAEAINQATPTITWATPAAILYGTPLNGTQLNATASVPGTFAYSPAANTVLSVGNQTLSVTFTPTDSTDYSTATATVTLVVNPGPPTITSPASGSSTTNSSVTLMGTSIPSASVTILDGTAPAGTTTADSSGNFSVGLLLAIGVHSLTAMQTVNGITSAASAAVSITVVALPPVVITDNETITVTDAASFPDVFDAENIKVSDQVMVYAFFPIAISPAPPLFAAVQNRLYSGLTFSATGGYQGLTLSETGVVPGITFSINGASMVFSGTPTQTGSFPFTVTATDTIGNTVSQNYALAVAAGCPVISVSPSGSLGMVTAGTSFSQTFIASGGIGTTTWSTASALPLGINFSAGVLSGIPTQSGTFALTITATDQNGCQGSSNVSLVVLPPPAVITDNETITVTDAVSFPDVFDSESVKVTDQVFIQVISPTTTSISAQGVVNGTPSAVTVSVSSPYGTVSGNVTLSVDGGTATTMALSSGSAVFNAGILTPGTHSLAASFPAQGSFLASTATGAVFVSQPPAFTSANATTFTVGAAGTFGVTTTGAPYPSLTIPPGTLPAGVTFTDNLNGTGTLAGIPAPGTGGIYPLTISANNGVGAPVLQSFTLTVNQVPTITSGSSTTFTEGVPGSFTLTSTGFPIPALSESPTLPAGLNFVDNGDGTATLAGTPSVGTQGSYTITIAAANGVLPNAPQNFTLNINLGPAITSGSGTTFTEQMAGSFLVTTMGFPVPSLTETGPLPTGVTFTDNHDGTASLAGTPAVGPSNVYPITITANNGAGASTTQAFTLTVNSTAAITSGSTTTFTVGSAGFFSITTMGTPAPSLTFTGTLPTGVIFVDNGNGTATLSGTPAAGTANSYPLAITANNGVGTAAMQNFTLVVNQGAAILSGNSTTFTVGVAGTFTVMTSGSPTPALTETPPTLPAGVTFVDNGDGTATLSGTPAAGTGGAYAMTITANNGVDLPAVQTFTLNINQNPAITSSNTVTFIEQVMSSFVVTATGDPIPALSEVGNLPNGVMFVDNGDGTASLGGIPAAGSSGQYGFTITASNGVLPNATQTFTLTVVSALSFTSPNATTFTSGMPSLFLATTSGSPTPSLTESGALPSGITFTDNRDGTATLAGNAAASAGGIYSLTFTAHNGISSDVTQTFTLMITANKTAPVITWASPAPINQGEALGSAQLDATANVPGTFTYSPAAGTVLSIGTHTLSVSFTPTNTAAYTTATATVQINVLGITPFTIGGTVSGLGVGESLVLLDNGGNALKVRNGFLPPYPKFVFTQVLATGAHYNVTVGMQPVGQLCTVANGSGTVGGDVTSIAVSCYAAATIGGHVSGLGLRESLVLLNNGGNALTIRNPTSQTGPIPFTFSMALANGATFDVTVGTQPLEQICTVTNGTGTVVGANKVTGVAVECK